MLVVSKVIVLGAASNTRVQIGEIEFVEPLDDSDSRLIYTSVNPPQYIESVGPWKAQHLVVYRSTHQFAACKIVALGYGCTELHLTWTTPPDIVINAQNQVETINGPVFDHCQDPVPDLTFQFFDMSGA